MEDLGQFDVIVIGAGVMGSAAAYYAAKRGRKTLLLEQFDFLHHRGSSHGESRGLRATYPSSFYCPMVIESERLWREAESEIGYKVYSKTQHIDMGPADKPSLRALMATAKEHSIDHRVLDSHQVNRYFSGIIELPEDWIGVVSEPGGVLKPSKSVAMFQALAIKNGATLKDNTEIVDVVADGERGGVLVSSKSGEKFRGKKCVVAAGAWLSKLVKRVSGGGDVLPIQPVETRVTYWKIKEGREHGFSVDGGFPTFVSYGEQNLYGTPAMEFPDLFKVGAHGGRQCDPDQRTWGPEVAAGEVGTGTLMVDKIRAWIKERFGDLINWQDGPVMSQSCLYSVTPDEDYMIDFLGGGFKEDVVVAGGFSGHGFKMAPLIGRIVADLAIGGKAAAEQCEYEIKYFKLGRFKGNPKGNKKGFEEQVRIRSAI